MLASNTKLAKKVALLKRMGMFAEGDTSVIVRRAIAGHELERAYELVYQVFVEKGYIDPEMKGIRIRPFEALPEMATFVAETDGQVVGVMSIVPDSSDFGLPSDQAFDAELGVLRRQGHRVAEVTNLAIATEYRRSSVFTELARAIHAHAVAMDYDDIFIAISPGHVGFFRDILQFDNWGDARDYSAGKEDVVVGMRWNMRTLEDRFLQADAVLNDEAFLADHFYRNNACHGLVRAWAALAKRSLLDPAALCRLFTERTDLLEHCSPEQLDGLRRRWGAPVFEAVCQEASAALALA